MFSTKFSSIMPLRLFWNLILESSSLFLWNSSASYRLNDVYWCHALALPWPVVAWPAQTPACAAVAWPAQTPACAAVGVARA